MDYYTITDEDEIATLPIMEKELRASLNEFSLATLDKGGRWVDFDGNKRGILQNWDDVYERCIDGYIVFYVVKIIERGIYNKNEIYSIFKKEVFPYLQKYGCDEKGMYDIFQHVWNCKCTKENGNISKLKTVKDIALNKQPIVLRIINNNMFLICFGIAIFMGAIFIGEHFKVGDKNSPLFVSSLMTFLGFFTMESKVGIYSAFIPVALALLVCGYNILFNDGFIIMTCKMWLYMALFYMFWFPVLWINYSRMKDAKIL